MEKERIINLSERLYEAANSLNILNSISWPKTVQDEFFRHKAQRLPVISYEPFDARPVLAEIRQVRAQVDESTRIGEWISRTGRRIEQSALLLAHRGQPEFRDYSIQLFGTPSDPLQNGMCTTWDLAEHFEQIFNSLDHFELGAPPEERLTASELATHMSRAVDQMFGDLAPEVVLDPDLASNAHAARTRISIRTGARFSDKDVDQLIHHEAYIHVATSLNGFLQPHLRILGYSHAGTSKTQEGLAIFAEFITGATDLDRLRRLSDRVFAIQKALDGADFIDIYRYYLERTDNPDQSFQNAKRVFRGGTVTGGIPFTKDIVYLEGLVNVHNFIRLAISKGKLDNLDLLFVGKLALLDLPALKELNDMGLIAPARFLPPWYQDKRFLISQMSFSSFLNRIELSHVEAYYEKLLT